MPKGGCHDQDDVTMNKDPLSQHSTPPVNPVALGEQAGAGAGVGVSAPSTLTPGRIAVLNGWIIAMLGIVLYCLAMLGGDPAADGTLLQRGWMGSGAIVLLIMGVSLWLYGAYTFLQELEDHPAQEDDGPSF